MAQFTGKETMTQLNDEHLEVIEKNKIERYERQKLTYLEDRIKVLEKSIGSINKILGRFQMTENKESKDPFIKVMEQGEKES